MGALTIDRHHLPFWPAAAFAAVAWLVAWLASWPLSQWLAFDLFGLEQGSAVGEAVAFFLYDVPKVLLLLLGIVTIVSFLRSYIPPERVRAALAGRGVVIGTVSAAAFGVVTPFCSCSAVPLFIGFLQAGIPVGVTLAFLISSPLVNEVALVLLLGIVTIVSFLRSYVPAERVRAALTGRGVVVGTVSAAAFGVVTPFCSCSAVPLFIGFLQAGIPVGVTLAFLISSPLVNEVALVLLLGLFGIEIAVFYLVAGLAIAIASGLILGRLPLERWIEPWVLEARDAGSGPAQVIVVKPSTEERLRDAWDSTRSLVRKVWPWVVIGIGVGAFIHGYVPTDVIVDIGGADNPLAVPIVVALAVPLYAGAAGVIPIVETLLDKGLPLGTVLAFMMATVAISLPEFVILRRVARVPLLLIFLAVVVAGILAVGFLFNALGM